MAIWSLLERMLLTVVPLKRRSRLEGEMKALCIAEVHEFRARVASRNS